MLAGVGGESQPLTLLFLDRERRADGDHVTAQWRCAKKVFRIIIEKKQNTQKKTKTKHSILLKQREYK